MILDCQDLEDKMAQQGHEETQVQPVMQDKSVIQDQGVKQVPMDLPVFLVRQAPMVFLGLLVPLGPQVVLDLKDLLVRSDHSDRQAKSETLVHLEILEVLG